MLMGVLTGALERGRVTVQLVKTVKLQEETVQLSVSCAKGKITHISLHVCPAPVVQRKVTPGLADLLAKVVVALGVVDRAVLADGADEEGQNVVQVRVVGLDRDVVVPRDEAVLSVS